MNILLYSGLQKNSPGGIGSWTEKYLSYFNRQNEIHISFVNNAIIGKRTTNFEKYYLFSEIKRLFCIGKQFKKALKSDCDLVHINSSCSAFGILRDYYLIKKIIRKKVPYILHFHCDIEFQLSKWPAFLKKKALNVLTTIGKKAAAIIVLNQTSLNLLRKRFGIESVVIPNFTDAQFDFAEKKIIKEKIETIIFVGHAIKEKGVYELVNAAKSVKDINFLIVGEKNNDIFEYCEGIENVNLTGIRQHSEVVRLLRDVADVFVLPSYSEGFSMALLEAMSVGAPCIVSDVGANKEMIENKGGVVLKNITSDEIVSAIHSLSDKSVRAAMSEWNIKKVYSCYSTSSVMVSIKNLYERICIRNGGLL